MDGTEPLLWGWGGDPLGLIGCCLFLRKEKAIRSSSSDWVRLLCPDFGLRLMGLAVGVSIEG